MANDGLKELYIDELKDLYNAESQLVKALPKMAKSASWDQLRQGFEEHLEQTKDTCSVWRRFSRNWKKARRVKSVWEWRDWLRKVLK